MTIQKIVLQTFLVCCCTLKISTNIQQAITYELSPGRFGDNLVSYIHAKWIAYKYHLPLLYRPFIYSDRLLVHERELHYTDSIKARFDKVVILSGKLTINPQDTSSALYFVPYFPESNYEKHHGIDFTGKPWDFFNVAWLDRGFIDELRKVIAPRAFITIPQTYLPSNRIAVAVHLRRGGNHDTPETIPAFPLKFVPDDFYIDHIKKLYFMLNKHPLYVYLFTDDNNPAQLMSTFKKCLQGYNIQFACREQNNSDTTNVIEDFFALQQFDCLIHSESNFSLIMGKIGNYLATIYPDSCHKDEHNQIIYDHINIIIDSKHKKITTFTKPKDNLCQYEFLIKK